MSTPARSKITRSSSFHLYLKIHIPKILGIALSFWPGSTHSNLKLQGSRRAYLQRKDIMEINEMLRSVRQSIVSLLRINFRISEIVVDLTIR